MYIAILVCMQIWNIYNDIIIIVLRSKKQPMDFQHSDKTSRRVQQWRFEVNYKQYIFCINTTQV